MTYRKKLIEVDLPLEDINRKSVREQPIRPRCIYSGNGIHLGIDFRYKE